MQASAWRCLPVACWPASRVHCATKPRRRRTNRTIHGLRVVQYGPRAATPAGRRAGIATLLEHAGHVLQWKEASEIAPPEPQQRARLAFDRLGPTFVKLGHMPLT